MANQTTIDTYSKHMEEFSSIFEIRDKRLRIKLGEAAYKDSYAIFTKMKDLLLRVNVLLPDISNTALSEISNKLRHFNAHAEAIRSISDQEFIDPINKRHNEEKFESFYDGILDFLPLVVTLEVQKSGALHSDWQDQISKLISEADQQFEISVRAQHQQAVAMLNEVQTLAARIEELHAEASTDAALRAVKDQFKEAVKEAREHRKIWSYSGGIAVVIFFLLLVGFATFLKPDYQNDSAGFHWSAVYSTVIRLTLLTAVGALVSFCAKMYRAHSHLYEHARHRLKMVNSYSTFIDSAKTNEQRDIILSKLVDTIAHFGSSGPLQNEDDALHPSKMTIETINKSISAATKAQ